MTLLIVSAGSTLSMLKLIGPAGVGLPAASVASAVALTAPCPSVVMSCAVNCTACGAPVPVKVFVTLPAVPANVTTTPTFNSAVRLMRPALADDSVRLTTGPALL